MGRGAKGDMVSNSESESRAEDIITALLVAPAVKLLVLFSKPNGPNVNFWFTLDYRHQAQCSTFVFVASAVHQSELKTIQSITWEHIFLNMFIDSSTWCT